MVMFVKGGCFRQTDPLLTMPSASTVMLTIIGGGPTAGFRVFLKTRTRRIPGEVPA